MVTAGALLTCPGGSLLDSSLPAQSHSLIRPRGMDAELCGMWGKAAQPMQEQVLGERMLLVKHQSQERSETSNCSVGLCLHEKSECFIHGVVQVLNK